MLCDIFSNNGCVEGILLRLRTYKDPDLPHDVKVIVLTMKLSWIYFKFKIHKIYSSCFNFVL